MLIVVPPYYENGTNGGADDGMTDSHGRTDNSQGRTQHECPVRRE
jgi:hypothetical protein